MQSNRTSSRKPIKTLGLYATVSVFAVCSVMGGTAYAQATWTGATDNEFSDGTNWDTTPTAPGPGDTAIINTGTPEVTTVETVDQLEVDGADLTVTSTGDLTVSSGATIENNGSINIDAFGAINADISVLTGGTVSNSGDAFGTISNTNGTVDNLGAGHIDEVTTNGGPSSVTNSNTADIDLIGINSGTVTNNDTANIDQIDDNNGTVNNNDDAEIGTIATNDGNVNNNNTAHTAEVTTNSATGTISNSSTADIDLIGTNDGTVTNNDTANIDQIDDNNDTVNNNDDAEIGTIATNDGDVNNNNTAHIAEVTTNSATGTISNSSTADIDLIGTNDGTVTNNDTANIDQIDDNNDTVNNNDDAEIGTIGTNDGDVNNNNTAHIAEVTTNSATGTINNSSTADIDLIGTNDGTVTNNDSANIDLISDNNDAVDNNDSATIGTITQNDGTVNNNNDAHIDALTVNDTLGTLINSNTADVDLVATNNGTINNNDSAAIGTVTTNDGTIVNSDTATIDTVANNTGTITNRNNGELTTVTQNSVAGTINNDNTADIGLVATNNGTLNNNDSASIGTVTTNDGTIVNSNTATIDTVANNTGTITNRNNGELTTVTQNSVAGTINNDNTADIGLIATNNGTINNNDSAKIDLVDTNSGLIENGANIGTVADNAGMLANHDDATVAEVTVNSGTVDNSDKAEISRVSTNTTDGLIENSDSAVIEAIALNQGRVTNSDTARIDEISSNTGNVENRDEARITLIASNAGQVINQGTATIDKIVNDAADAIIRNSKNAHIGALVNKDGTTLNSGTIGQATVVNGTLVTTSRIDGALDVKGGRVIAEGFVGGDITVAKGGRVVLSGNLDHQANFNNAGSLSLSQTRIALNNQGHTFVNTGSIDLHEGNEKAGDRLVIAGDVNNRLGTVRLDTNIRTNKTDRIVVKGDLKGKIRLALETIGKAKKDLLNEPGRVLLIDVEGDNSSTIAQKKHLEQELSDIWYRRTIDKNAHGDWVMKSRLSMAPVGSIVGSIASAQNLINTTMARPENAFVASNALIANAENPASDKCGPAGFVRALGGLSSVSLQTSSDVADTITSQVEARYAGTIFGADFGCANANGQDLSVNLGLFGILSGGTTSQSQNLGDAGGMITANNSFDTKGLGTYLNVEKDGFRAYAQVGYDRTLFDVQSFVDGTQFIGKKNIANDRYYASAQASYRFELPSDFYLTPALGVNYSLSDTANVPLTGDYAGDTIKLDRQQMILGFANLTVARPVWLNDEKNKSLTVFVGLTGYHDFGHGTVGTYEPDSTANRIRTSTQNMGTYGELSLGLDYAHLLVDETGSVREFKAGARADVTFGERIQGARLLGQMRFQF